MSGKELLLFPTEEGKFKAVKDEYVIYCESEKVLEEVKEAMTKRKPKSCKNFVDVCSCGKAVYPHMKFCSQCGQALKWESA